MSCQNDSQIIIGVNVSVLTELDELWARGCMIWLQLQHLWCRTHETGRPPEDEKKAQSLHQNWTIIVYHICRNRHDENFCLPLLVLRLLQSMELQCSFRVWTWKNQCKCSNELDTLIWWMMFKVRASFCVTYSWHPPMIPMRPSCPLCFLDVSGGTMFLTSERVSSSMPLCDVEPKL